ncbi:MAG: cache domain-containing protein, partial [Calditrichia bacterium]|nr:cache domain-containing protein [Calditrichia bacterium]
MALKRFSDWGILSKLASLIIISILPMALLMIFYFLNKVENKLYEEKEMATRHVVETAYHVIETSYNKFKNDTLSEEEAKELAKTGIKELKYAGNNYFWINDMGKPFPKMVMHPIAPQLDGKILNNKKYNCAMGKNQNLFQAMVEVTAADGEGFVDYIWPRPIEGGLSEDQPKLSYVKRIVEWNWILGT